MCCIWLSSLALPTGQGGPITTTERLLRIVREMQVILAMACPFKKATAHLQISSSDVSFMIVTQRLQLMQLYNK